MAIAYFSTWTTFGTWLPGDKRGWFQRDQGIQQPEPTRVLAANLIMNADAFTLDHEQRCIVTETVIAHCEIRNWHLHAVNCRSNHVHVVVTAPNRLIEIPREQLKSWCTRNLREAERLRGIADSAVRRPWWTERGWDLFVDDEKHLEEVISYVLEGQDHR